MVITTAPASLPTASNERKVPEELLRNYDVARRPTFKELVSREQSDLRAVLQHYLSDIQFKNPRILDICCGTMHEEPLLYELFGEGTSMIGIDARQSSVEKAAELGRKSVRLGDLRYLNEYVEGTFDIVVGRNVPLNPNGGLWRLEYDDPWPGIIFPNIASVMNDNSILFLTLLMEDEFYRAQQILSRHKFRILLEEKNPIPVRSDLVCVAADMKDTYVITAKAPLP